MEAEPVGSTGTGVTAWERRIHTLTRMSMCDTVLPENPPLWLGDHTLSARAGTLLSCPHRDFFDFYRSLRHLCLTKWKHTIHFQSVLISEPAKPLLILLVRTENSPCEPQTLDDKGVSMFQRSHSAGTLITEERAHTGGRGCGGNPCTFPSILLRI